MKPSKNVDDLAAGLRQAMETPPPIPEAPIREASQTVAKRPANANKARRGRPATETQGITLRPAKEVLRRYTNAAADRTRKLGRVVSAQEIMLERLDGGP